MDRAVPILLKMKRLRGYRAIGYARDVAPLGLQEVEDVPWSNATKRCFEPSKTRHEENDGHQVPFEREAR